MIKFRKDKVGRNAYKVTKKWRLGPHIFVCGEDLIFRICYLRNKKGTQYIQLSIKIKECSDCGCGS